VLLVILRPVASPERLILPPTMAVGAAKGLDSKPYLAARFGRCHSRAADGMLTRRKFLVVSRQMGIFTAASGVAADLRSDNNKVARDNGRRCAEAGESGLPGDIFVRTPARRQAAFGRDAQAPQSAPLRPITSGKVDRRH
jgi:hypothetical protein